MKEKTINENYVLYESIKLSSDSIFQINSMRP